MKKLKEFIISIREAFGHCNHEYVDDRGPESIKVWDNPKGEYPLEEHIVYIQRCKKCNNIRKIDIKL